MSSIYTKSYARTTKPMELPTLIDVQLRSFEQFIDEGLAELFDEISPIESFNGDLKLYFPSKRKEVEDFNLTYWFGEPKYSVEECVEPGSWLKGNGESARDRVTLPGYYGSDAYERSARG